MRAWTGALAFGWVAVAPVCVLRAASTMEAQPGAIAVDEARKYVGQTAIVCGKAVGFQYAVVEDGIETILYVDRPASEAVFAIRILGGRRREFKPPPEQQFRDQAICVTGTIGTKNGLTQVDVEKPEQLVTREPRIQLPKLPDGIMPGGPVPEGLVLPKVVREVNPRYTAAALRAGITGIIEVEAIVLPDGTVGHVELTRSIDPLLGLDDEAIRAVKQWVFEPGTRLGQPVPVLVTIEQTFTLKSQPPPPRESAIGRQPCGSEPGASSRSTNSRELQLTAIQKLGTH